VAKHNRYATMEAAEQLRAERAGRGAGHGRLWGTQPERKQWIRERVWEPLMPPLLRPFAYFAYAYVFRLGFLDGRAGLTYHLLQGLAYRLMIEVKYLALRASGEESINPAPPPR
jgi:hypothetical protein